MGTFRLGWVPFPLALAAAPLVAAAEPVSFQRDIKPIMADTCFRCHGPDASSRMAGLRLDLREEALKPTASGVTPIVPGDPARSAIIDRIFAQNPGRIMPPRQAHKPLNDKQKALIRQWVAEGAPYEGHWAYQPIRRPPVPRVDEHGTPVRNPIDAFIRDRLRREGLAPSPEADPRTLLRRVTLDLTGLPPSPAEAERFLADPSPAAYAALVDRLLASPHYAEKQALHWLDAVRYADTCGFHGDNPFPAWPYRDWVLAAFRDNMPFDQFTREQLAGDLLPNATTASRVASAYNRLNRTSAEGGIQPAEYLAKYAADRVRTTSTVWLGATMGCAECHDHKFDPITSRDFYSFKAFFADIKETGLVPDRGEKAWGSQLVLATAAQQQALADLETRLRDTRERLAAAARDLSSRLPAWEAALKADADAKRLAWRYQTPLSARSAHGAHLTVHGNEPIEVNYFAGTSLFTYREPAYGLVVASGPNPDRETYTVTFRPGAGEWTALGLEVVQDEHLPGIRVARGSDRLMVTEIEADLLPAPGASWRPLTFSRATSNVSNPLFELPPYGAIDGDPSTGWGIITYGENKNFFLALRLREKLQTTADSVLLVRIRHDSEHRRATIGRFRLALSAGTHSWPEGLDARSRGQRAVTEAELNLSGLPDRLRRVLAKPDSDRTAADREALLAHFEWMSPELEPLVSERDRLEARLRWLDLSIPRVVVTEAGDPQPTRVLARGNFMDETGEIVEPAIPAAFGRVAPEGRRANRLDLAEWLLARDNPLTARVWVNRTWRQFFGTGLSKVLDDLGSQGEAPSHPELLDWLAAEFQQNWDMKHIIRTIVLSHTYRQSSHAPPALLERDPDNRLLARQSRFRVDAEIVRDIALSVSGLLVPDFGGPSVKPYQPRGYLAALNFPTRDYSESHGAALYRRGVYTHWQRSFLNPTLAAFDAPSREECTINRVNSNTPLQALVLLNDPVFVEAARALAQNMLRHGGPDLASRLRWAFRRTLQRDPDAAELRVLTTLYAKDHARFRAAPQAARALMAIGEAPVPREADPAVLAALTTAARALLNLHETITRY